MCETFSCGHNPVCDSASLASLQFCRVSRRRRHRRLLCRAQFNAPDESSLSPRRESSTKRVVLYTLNLFDLASFIDPPSQETCSSSIESNASCNKAPA